MDATPLFKPTPSSEDEPESAASFARAPRKYLPGRLLDAYLFGQVAEATLRGLAMFVMLLLFFAVITATRKMLDNSLSISGAAQLIAYQLPRIFLFTLPMSTLYGTLHAFGELSSSREIIGMWGGGMSFKRMLGPPLLWASMLAITAFVVQENIVPGAEGAKDRLLADQVSQSSLVMKDIYKPVKSADGSEILLRADEFDARSKTLLNPSVIKISAQRDVETSFHGSKAVWDEAAQAWMFEDLNTRSFNEPEQAKSSGAAVVGGSSSSVAIEAPGPALLLKPALSRDENLRKHNFEFVSLQDLQAWKSLNEQEAQKPGLLERKRREARIEASSATYGIHDKISTPLICVALVLVGAPMGLRPQRSASGFSLGLSLVILLIYYVVWTWANQVGRGGLVNPFLMAYLPLGITSVAGAVMLWKKARTS